MTNKSKNDYLLKIKDRYRHAGRRAKTRILDEFCEVCNHHRKHAIRLLNQDGRRKRKKPGRPSKYGLEEIRVLESIWKSSGYPCSVRLVGMIPLWLHSYEQEHGYLDELVRKKVLGVKPRTLDDALRPTRRKHGFRGLSGTRPGTYLKNTIPVKVSHRDVTEPGYFQADTVAHCGGSMEGSFVWSLTFTDIFSGWTENGAVWNKGQYEVHKVLESKEDKLPFAVKGFHTDNGGEFINHHLHSFYVDREVPVAMTRGRGGKSNDNPHVEQKNYTHVRKLLGYQRIEDKSLITLINQLYEASGLLSNFFCTNRKLVFKERRGSKYYKRYDAPATPCQRLLASEHITEIQKTYLTELQTNLDPYKLRRIIDAKLRRIFERLR